MRLIETGFLIGSAGLVLAISGLAGCHASTEATPKDTPIVAGGGSVYGCSYGIEADGWKKKFLEKHYSASLHADSPDSANYQSGIDDLWFTNFTNGPTNPIVKTNGWVISIFNKAAGGGSNPTPAVMFCSDKSCSASSSSPNRCQRSFDKNGRVYFEIRPGAQVNPAPGSPVHQINFHDPTASCNPGGIASCDDIYSVKLETCSDLASSPTYECPQDAPPGQKCRISVGVSHDPPPCN
jgi:hypothetical protein